MGSSAKTEKFFISGSQERKRCTLLGPKHKSAICDRTPPSTHQTKSICVQESSGVTNLQTKLNYLDSFKSYCNSSDLGFLSSGGGTGGWGGVWGDQL